MLSSRIHRQPGVEVGDGAEQQARAPPDGDVDATWRWEDAEVRLRVAYDKAGFSGWAGAALKELESEGEQERSRRERLSKQNKPV